MSSNQGAETSLRRVRLLRGYGALAVAVVLGAFLWVAPGERPSPVLYAIVVSSIALIGVQQLWQAGRTGRDTVAQLHPFLDPNRLPVDERLRVFRRQLIAGAIVFPLISVMTAIQLQRFESCGQERVTLWPPLALLYDHFGYWTAVLAPLVVGVVLSAPLIARLRRGH
jgi:hypothetical protein